MSCTKNIKQDSDLLVDGNIVGLEEELQALKICQKQFIVWSGGMTGENIQIRGKQTSLFPVYQTLRLIIPIPTERSPPTLLEKFEGLKLKFYCFSTVHGVAISKSKQNLLATSRFDCTFFMHMRRTTVL